MVEGLTGLMGMEVFITRMDLLRVNTQLEAAVEWWTAKSHRSPPSMYWVIGRIARLVDRGQAKARPFEVFALAAADLNSDRALGARLACSAFCDELGPDLELLIVSWCASQKGAPHPAPRTW